MNKKNTIDRARQTTVFLSAILTAIGFFSLFGLHEVETIGELVANIVNAYETLRDAIFLPILNILKIYISSTLLDLLIIYTLVFFNIVTPSIRIFLKLAMGIEDDRNLPVLSLHVMSLAIFIGIHALVIGSLISIFGHSKLPLINWMIVIFITMVVGIIIVLIFVFTFEFGKDSGFEPLLLGFLRLVQIVLIFMTLAGVSKYLSLQLGSLVVGLAFVLTLLFILLQPSIIE